MGIPFTHGSQKGRILAALWRLSPFEVSDNPRQVSLTKHAGPFQWPACRGGRAQLFFESAIAIPQLEGIASAIAIPQLFKEMLLRNRNFF